MGCECVRPIIKFESETGERNTVKILAFAHLYQTITLNDSSRTSQRLVPEPRGKKGMDC